MEVFAEQSIERYAPPPGRERLHWPLEFPEIFVDEYGAARPDGGFDAVIGNPPYIRVQELGRPLANYARGRFATASGNFDAYVLFLERGLALLAPEGRLGFIVPNKLFKLDFAERTRTALSREELVDQVLDFGASQLFAGATNYTCILVLDRGGTTELAYRRLHGTRSEVLAELSTGGAVPAQFFTTRELGSDPWVLVPPEEATVMDLARSESVRLDEAAGGIFTGLQTSADDVYIVEDRGWRGDHRIVYSRASGREVELEPDLLHSLASGSDVEPYAFRPLRDLILFPYRLDGDSMRLLASYELNALGKTADYLEEHERRLRGRESGRMDHDGWYGYVYPKSLGLHEGPKVGIPRLCHRLRASWDREGGVYLDNVDVNGIVLGELSGPFLTLLLNSQLLDWIFRRHSVPFQNDFWSANKQFISGLPIRLGAAAESAELAARGTQLHDLATELGVERSGFLDWLADTVGGRRGGLPGQRSLDAYETLTAENVVARLAQGRARLETDPRERDVRELIAREHHRSVHRLLPAVGELERLRAEADRLVFDLYGIPAAMRELVDREYE